MFALDDYDYELPEALIAQVPARQRDRSRLLCLQRGTGRMAHQQFQDLPDLLTPKDLLVVNDTEVIPGRLNAHKETGGKAEVLILDYTSPQPDQSDPAPHTFQCLVKSSRTPKSGSRLFFEQGLTAEVLDCRDGICNLHFSANGNFEEILYRIGRTPLPPYIKRKSKETAEADQRTYQTVYAAHKGAIAAPTAGLHFTEPLLATLRANGVAIAPITLHVGYGTFMPVRVGDIRQHAMHTERFTLPPATAQHINRTRQEGGRIIAVGTTCVRTLEFVADEQGHVQPQSGHCDLFIYPGYRFKTVDAMITNFHLPKSTLLMLVTAFAGLETIRSAYREAVRRQYRFYSYGDAMLIHG